MNKSIGWSIVLLLAGLSASAQNETDALRYSMQQYGATGRNAGMAGAMGAVGADISAVMINPAGLGQYRAGEFMIGLGAYSFNNQANYIGSTNRTSAFNMNLPNVGIVLSQVLTKKGKEVTEGGWSSYAFGFGINRINNFWRQSNYQGLNHKSSITDYFADRAQGQTTAELGTYNTIEGLAYNTYLINPAGGNNYVSALQDTGRNVMQGGRIDAEGNMYQYDISFGANYSHKFYIGASLFFQSVSYQSTEEYYEKDQGTIDNFKQMHYQTDVSTRGSGVGFKIGFLARPSQYFRFGGSIQTPVNLNLRDNYQYHMSSQFDDGVNNSDLSSEPGFYKYRVQTPFRATLSAAAILGKLGIIAFDAEHVDYSRAQLSASDYSFSTENNNIANLYRPTWNFRLGTEWVYEVFRFRAGVSYYTSPFREGLLVSPREAARPGFSLGLGLKQDDFYVDLGYVHTAFTDYYTPYPQPSGRQNYSVINSNTANQFVLTVGVKFN